MKFHPFAYLFFHDARRLGEAIQRALGDRLIVIYPQPHSYSGDSPAAYFEPYPLRLELNDGSYSLLKEAVSIDPLELRAFIQSGELCDFAGRIASALIRCNLNSK